MKKKLIFATNKWEQIFFCGKIHFIYLPKCDILVYMDKFLVIDGNNIMNRAFFGLPKLTSVNGEPCNAVFGFSNILVKLISDISPKYIMVAFDSGRHTFRTDMYSEYKAQRTQMADELASQFPIMKELLGHMGITVCCQPGIEADDLIGTLTRKFDAEFILLSGDKDLLQLINDNTTVWMLQKGLANVDKVDAPRLKEWMGLTPDQIIDYKALSGDPSDNIPGVRGVGDKSATALLSEYHSIENLYDNIDSVKRDTLREKLIAGRDMCFLSKKLATIVTDVPFDYKLGDFEYDYPFNAKVKSMFGRLDFKSILLRNIFDKNAVDDTPVEPKKGAKQISFLSTEETENPNTLPNVLVSKVRIDSADELGMLVQKLHKNAEIALGHDGNEWHFADRTHLYVMADDVADSETIARHMRTICEDDAVTKIVYDGKALKHTLADIGVAVDNIFDISLAVYLSKGSDISLRQKDIFKAHSLDESASVANFFAMKEYYTKLMDEQGLTRLYNDVEIKLLDVLFDMERTGFAVDRDEIHRLIDEYKVQVAEVKAKIMELAGEEFNLNSPKQLADILFVKLAIPRKGRVSTSIEVLEEIQNKHAIVPYIIRYRKLSKILSTYLEGLLPHVKADGKVHTTFLQTMTSTGRLSSREPNLQNMPIRDEESRILRKLFVSSFENGKLTDADYNQIELRLLAHFSQDVAMMNALDGDIHTATASKIYNVPESEVTSQMRLNAKRVNFGIIYGIGKYRLSKQIGSTFEQAGQFMQKYMETYPSVEKYLTDSVATAKAKGYATTLLDRRRYIPEINSKSRVLRGTGERIAMNMPLQGTASDIIKLAMVRVHDRLKRDKLKSKLILQVHDELVIDTYPGEEEAVARILQSDMANAIKLTVDLPVEVKCGVTLYDAK